MKSGERSIFADRRAGNDRRGTGRPPTDPGLDAEQRKGDRRVRHHSNRGAWWLQTNYIDREIFNE
jgi:hypothetical protein